MRVLLVDHGSLVSGAERSMLELILGLEGRVDVAVACPPTGPLADLLAGTGTEIRPVVPADGSFKLRPLLTARFLGGLVRMGRQLRGAAVGFDVVHANSIRAGLACLIAFGVRRRRRRVRVIIHLRDSLPASPAGRAVRAAIRLTADHIIGISAHTAANFGLSGRVSVIHNPVDLERFTPGGPCADIPGEGPVLGVFGQITPWKGQDDAIRTLGLLDRPARLLIVGEAKFVSASTRFDNRAFEAGLRRLARGLDVSFLGEREDVPELMRACDLVLVPSWEEPFGRVIIEAMGCGTPVLATSQGGPPEIIDDGTTGRLLPPRDPALWARAVEALLDDPAARDRIGHAATVAAGRFDRDTHAAEVLLLYRTVLAAR